MKRLVLWVLTVSLILTGSLASAAGQTPVPRAPVTTPVDQLTLRITEGNGYTFLVDSAGVVQAQEFQQVTNGGGFPEVMSQDARDFYTRTHVRDVYITAANLVPPEANAAGAGINALSVEMRVATFADPASAATYVADFIPEIRIQAEVAGTNPNITAVATLPDHDEAITGISGMTQYRDIDTGDVTGEMPYTRFLAQVGSTLASASVSGEDAALNEAIARELVLAQVACVQADVPCAPVPIPTAFPNSPTPEAPTSDTTPATGTATVIVARANIRATPSAGGEVVAIATTGETLTVTGSPVDAEGYTWLPVTTASGVSGWVASQLVQISD